MKKSIVILLLLSIFSCKRDEKSLVVQNLEEQTVSRSITDTADPNLNPNWDYYSSSVVLAQMYIMPQAGSSTPQLLSRNLPWFTAGNPLNNVEKDYLPELGWRLYMKDFGTPQRYAQVPFFALYNIYSGVLRFFVYNYKVVDLNENANTYYISELMFNTPGDINSSLSLFAPQDEFVKSKTNPSIKQSVITKRENTDPWLIFDFPMMNDPKKSELKLNIYSVKEFDANLGSDFSKITARSSLGMSKSNNSSFSESINKGYEYTSSTLSLLEAIKKFGGNDGDEDKANMLMNNQISNIHQSETIEAKSLILGTVIKAVGIIKSAIGLVKTFSGGKKSTAATQTTLQYDGIVTTTGSINLTNIMYSVQFHQDANHPLNSQRYRPLFHGKTGIMSAPENFYLNATQHSHSSCFDMYSSDYIHFYNFNSRFVYDMIYDSFLNNPDLNGKVNVTKFEAYLVNNVLSEKGYFKQQDAPNYNTFRRYNTFKFLEYTPDQINNGIGYNSTHTNPVSLFSTLDNDEVQIHFGKIRFNRSGLARDYQWFDFMQENQPKIVLEIHYEITDPTYPIQDSKERIMQKVITPEFNYTKRTHSTGCPVF